MSYNILLIQDNPSDAPAIGWSRAEAAGQPLARVFHIIDASTREVIENPMALAVRGVETLEQLEFLREHRCPVGQGYYFSRPIVAGDLSRLLVAV